MGDHKDSAMVRNADKNRRLLEDSIDLLKLKRAEGDTTRFQEKYKNEAKELRFSTLFGSKTDKLGRYGAVRLPERNDVIKNMDTNGEMPKGVYFDPLGFKVIYPESVQRFGTEDEDLLQQEEMLVDDIEDSFVERVGDEIENARANDFERELMGNEKLNIGETLEDAEKKSNGRTGTEYFVEKYNAGKSFVPDEDIIRDIPDDFSLETIVYDPPPKYTLEWEIYNIEQTRGVGARIKGFFRSIFRVKEPTEDEVFLNFIKSFPEYQRLEKQGMDAAKEQGEKYDPKANIALNKYIAGMEAIRKAKSEGHSVVRMNAKKNGKKLSSYSFLFGTNGDGGAAGAVLGGVSNPAVLTPGYLSSEHKVTYPNFLRAAAKIRGVTGSMRTYSFMRYNCTSFVAEVAQAAGIPMRPEDTSKVMMSHRYHEQRVDNPYMLARMIERENAEKQDEKDSMKESEQRAASVANTVDSAIGAIVINMISDYKPRFDSNELIRILSERQIYSKTEIDSRLETFIARIVENGMRIDLKYPIEGLQGEKRNEALRNRKREKIYAFGSATEKGAIDKFFDPSNEDEMVAYMMKGQANIKGLWNTIRKGSVGSMNYTEAEAFARKFDLFPMYRAKYRNVGMFDDDTANKISLVLLRKIANWQDRNLRDYLRNTEGMKNARFLRKIAANMGTATMDMLGRGMLENETALRDFLNKTGITLPEDYEYDEKARAAKEENERLEEERRRKEAEKLKAGNDYKNAKILDMAPARMTFEMLQEMMDEISSFDLKEDAVGEFISIFSKVAGVEGKSNRGRLSLEEDIAQFLYQCARQFFATAEVTKCYVDILGSNSKRKSKDLLVKLFNTIATQVPRVDILVAINDSGII